MELDLRLDIVLPCYNPHPDFVDHLAHTRERLQMRYPGMPIRLIVVNDGSTRNFDEGVRRELAGRIPGTLIVDLCPNKGKGAAVRSGVAFCDAPYTIYTDIDMPYDLETMAGVIDRVREGCDVVIAVRNRSYYAKLTPLRKLMSHGSKTLNSLLLGIRHTDTQGGLKGLSPRAREVMLRTRIDDFLFDTEFIVLASRQKGFRIEQVESHIREGIELTSMSGRVMMRELRNFYRVMLRRWS